jgi:hypothetical protein
MPLNNPILNGKILVFYSFGLVSPVSGIILGATTLRITTNKSDTRHNGSVVMLSVIYLPLCCNQDSFTKDCKYRIGNTRPNHGIAT